MTERGSGRDVAARVGALRARERLLVKATAAVRASALLALVALVLAGASSLGLDRAVALAVAVWTALAGSFLGVVAPAWLGLRAADDLRRQARRVEALRPSLQGRLLVAIERVDGPRPGESAEIVEQVIADAERIASSVELSDVHPPTGLRRSWLGASAAWACAAAVLFVVGPSGVARYWLGAPAEAMARADVTEAGAEAAARVGDLTLRYVYPDYTGLEPYEVVNSTGEARAVPGTRVEVVARSASAIESAALMAYDDAPVEAEVRDGRMIRASFIIGPEAGSYRILTYAAGETRRSRELPIVPEPDLAPEVTLQSDAPTIEVAVNQWLDLAWHARDDFGISRVVVSVDGKDVGADLKRPSSRVAEVSDVLHRRPVDLGMVIGGTYELAVAAWDNDTVSGEKRGQSGVVRVVVLGADGLARVTPQQRQELLGLLVDVLGDHLEEPFPPGTSAAEYARWGEAVNARYQPVVTYLEGFRTRRGRLVADFRPADIALEAGRALIRFTQVAFLPEVASAANADSVQMVQELRAEAISTLEDGILALDRLLRMAALREVAEAAPRLDEAGQRLADVLARPGVRPDEIAAVADEAQRLVEEVDALAEQLDEGGLQGFIQMHAAELRATLAGAREAMGAGQQEASQRLMSRAAERLRELATGIQDELQRRRDQADRKQGNAKNLIETLKKLAADQDALAGQVQEVRDRLGAGQTERLAELWKRLAALAGHAGEGAEAYRDGLVSAGRAFQEQELAGWAVSELTEARLGAELQDLTGTRGAADEASHAWAQVARRAQMLARPGQGGPSSGDVAEVRGRIQALLDAIEQLRRADQQVDPALSEQLRDLQDEQQALDAALEQARRDAEQVAEEFPVRPRGLEQALEHADERMRQAGEELGRGAGMQAQGSQQAASAHVREAIESLQDAMSQARRASSEMEPQESGEGEGEEEEGEGKGDEEEGEEGEEGDKSGGDGRSRPFELPEPEEFRTPEAYREALLKGMASDVPEEYRALKRRYYEELVHQ